MKNQKIGVPFVARLALGCVIFPHGAQNLLGWFGGSGFEATMTYLTEDVGVPWVISLLAIIVEFLGGLGLITGTLTRLSALAVGITMIFTALLVHLKNGFFMNWNGSQMGEGFEFHILAIGLAISIVIQGGGILSVDNYLRSKSSLENF